MDILFLLLFVAIFGAWSIWVTLRTEERNEASKKKKDEAEQRLGRPDSRP
jgi:ABC-type nickel/cobalt efflux system permease component RcnA